MVYTTAERTQKLKISFNRSNDSALLSLRQTRGFAALQFEHDGSVPAEGWQRGKLSHLLEGARSPLGFSPSPATTSLAGVGNRKSSFQTLNDVAREARAGKMYTDLGVR